MMKTLYLTILTTLSLTAYGQQGNQPAPPDDKVWSLQECIQYAFKNNIQVRQSELTVLNNELNLRQAQFNRLPNLNASTGLTNSVGRSVDPFTNDIISQDINSQSYNLNTSVTLFNGFGQVSAVQQSRANLEKANYDLEDQRNITALNIANNYLNILLANEQLQSARLNLETSRLQEEQRQKQLDAGAVAPQDLLLVKQQVATDEVTVIQAENNLDLARLILKQSLQLPASVEMEIEVPAIEIPTDELSGLDMEEVFQQSLALPSVKSAASQVESSRYGINIARANRYPSLSLNGGFGTNYSSAAPDFIPDGPNSVKENTYFNQLDFNQRRFVSLQVNIPIFNRFATNTQIGLAKIGWENAKYLEQGVKNQLRQDVEQAYYNARAALKTFNATSRQVETLELSFRNVTQRNELGAANAFEYNQIKNDFNRAQNDLIRAKYDYIFKLKVLEFYQEIGRAHV